MNIKSLLRDSEDTVGFLSVGDEVTVDTNWIGVNPKLKKGKVIGYEYSMASHDSPSEKLVKVEFEDGSKGAYNIYAVQELFPDSKKQISDSLEEGFSESDFEDYVISHRDEILDNMKSYDYTKKDFLTIGNYYDFAHILDADTRLFKDVDLRYYAKTVIELIGL